MSEKTGLEIGVGERFYFDTDELAFSVKADRVEGKVYRAGKAFGVEPGTVEVIDMATGESEVVPANASGTRPADTGGPGDGAFVVLRAE